MTSFEILIERCARKLEKDSDLFSYYNVSASEAECLLRDQIKGYLIDAIDLLYSKCEPLADFYDYSEEDFTFNFDLTKREVGLLSDLMRQVYYERQEALLGAFKVRMTPSDLNHITPSTERSTFLELLRDIRSENEAAISRYVSVERDTNKKKKIDYDKYDE